MANHRSQRRHLRHDHEFQVQFWPRGSRTGGEGTGTMLSAGGLLVSSKSRQPIGARLEIRFLDPVNGFVVEGEVVNTSNLGMGIRFLPTNELVAQIVIPELGTATVAPAEEKLAAGLGIYQVQYRDRDELRRDYLRHLSAGGMFVRTSQPAVLGNEVEVRVGVEGVETPPVKLRGKVIAPLPHGMGVEILNLQTVEDDLLRLAGLSAWS